MKAQHEFPYKEDYKTYLRLYYIGQVLQGMAASSRWESKFYSKTDAIELAIEYADELLKQLEPK